MHRLSALLLPLLASPLLAQTTTTSPRGFDLIEGNMVFAHWGASRRLQQVDNTSSGKPLVIKSFASRRNGGSAQAVSTRMFTLTLDLGLCDFGNISLDMDRNFLPNTRKTVISSQVNFPDWSAALPGPAPFDFNVPLTTPFIYTGANALVIDFSYTNNTSASSCSVDREYTTPGGGLTGTTGVQIGTGCVSTGQTATFDHKTAFMNQGALPDPRFALRFKVAGTYAPASAGVLLFIDTMDRNISSVVCATVHALPVISMPLLADAAGTVPETYLGFPYDAALENATIYSQLLAIDVGQPGFPVTLSNGCSTQIPPFSGTTSHPCTYSWYQLPGIPNYVFFGGGLVLELG